GPDSWEPEALGVPEDLRLGLAVTDVGVGRIEIVLAYEHQGELPERGEVECLVEDAFLDGAVAEAHDRDPVLAPHPERERGAGRVRDGPPHHRRGAHDPRPQPAQLHGPAPAPAT